MSKYILDASALLALLNSEPGSEIVQTLLPSSIMSTVNVAEVVSELNKRLNIDPNKAREMVTTMISQIVPFDLNQAVEAGRLRKITQHLGLSLGDRACIALSIFHNYPIYTADKLWANLQLHNTDIKLIR